MGDLCWEGHICTKLGFVFQVSPALLNRLANWETVGCESLSVGKWWAELTMLKNVALAEAVIFIESN